MESSKTADAEARFARVFVHYPAVCAYARRRGSSDPDEVAAEVMRVAWRRFPDVPEDDPLPWLLATARNVSLAQHRASQAHRASTLPETLESRSSEDVVISRAIDPALANALLACPAGEREALLLVAWERLTPAQAAKALGISTVAMRVRLHRARQRCLAALEQNNLESRVKPRILDNPPSLAKERP